MPASPDARTTRLLNRLVAGDPQAVSEALPLVYDELHELAARYMARQPGGHTLQPTALVNEAWLRLSGRADLEFECRKQFFGLAAKAMRSALVDHARRRDRDKRGGGAPRLTLATDVGALEGPDVDLLALDEALERLEERDPELSRLVELRFFAGLKHPEIAELTGTSLRSVERGWRLSRAFLHKVLSK